MGVTRQSQQLIREARDVLALLEPRNAALVQAAVLALAGKAGQAGDRYAQARILQLLQSRLCGRAVGAGGL